MPIDASIISSGLKTPENDPLSTVAKLQGLKQSVLQNRLLNQQVGGQEAMGRAVTANTDPGTGQTDWDKAAAALSQDPQGAFKVPEFAAQVLDRKAKEIANATAQAGLTQEQLQTAQKKYAAVGDWAASVAAQGARDPNALTAQAILTSAKTGLLDSGFINLQNPQEKDQFLSVITKFGNDPQANLELLKHVFLQSHATSEGVGMVQGTPQTVDIGGSIVNQQISPLTGEQQINAGLTKGRTPTEKKTLVSRYNPVTKANEFVTSESLVGDGTSGTKTGAVAQAGPALGEAEAASADAQAQVQNGQALQRRAGIVPNRKAAIDNLLVSLDKFGTGPHAQGWSNLMGLASQYGISTKGINESKAGQDEFNKLSAQIALDQWGTLGGTGTNDQLATTMKANPNETMSKLGIKNVAALLKGNEDAIKAQGDAWQKWIDAGHSQNTYGQFQTQFNQVYNPRVFQSVYMTPEQQKDMLGHMTAPEQKQFREDWVKAKRYGWIQ